MTHSIPLINLSCTCRQLSYRVLRKRRGVFLHTGEWYNEWCYSAISGILTFSHQFTIANVRTQYPGKKGGRKFVSASRSS